ncbi:hypothetical protein STIAU_5639 [Stigmatella aurantiaca DW4/3-1]|uniref:Uncharacterized protein n=1 Tax=Stigmatella aurantiaca (strain DW4/3-1) TaxID=378806 RepID=Q09DN6_STIAD|nr:hypothetical protein STIAU_5639 [Stigmatella aurantiaca DW4/3-1]
MAAGRAVAPDAGVRRIGGTISTGDQDAVGPLSSESAHAPIAPCASRASRPTASGAQRDMAELDIRGFQHQGNGGPACPSALACFSAAAARASRSTASARRRNLSRGGLASPSAAAPASPCAGLTRNTRCAMMGGYPETIAQLAQATAAVSCSSRRARRPGQADEAIEFFPSAVIGPRHEPGSSQHPAISAEGARSAFFSCEPRAVIASAVLATASGAVLASALEPGGQPSFARVASIERRGAPPSVDSVEASIAGQAAISSAPSSRLQDGAVQPHPLRIDDVQRDGRLAGPGRIGGEDVQPLQDNARVLLQVADLEGDGASGHQRGTLEGTVPVSSLPSVLPIQGDGARELQVGLGIGTLGQVQHRAPRVLGALHLLERFAQGLQRIGGSACRSVRACDGIHEEAQRRDSVDPIAIGVDALVVRQILVADEVAGAAAIGQPSVGQNPSLPAGAVLLALIQGFIEVEATHRCQGRPKCCPAQAQLPVLQHRCPQGSVPATPTMPPPGPTVTVGFTELFPCGNRYSTVLVATPATPRPKPIRLSNCWRLPSLAIWSASSRGASCVLFFNLS